MLYLDRNLKFKPEYSDPRLWESLGVPPFSAASAMALVSCAEIVLKGPRAIRRSLKMYERNTGRRDEATLGILDAVKAVSKILSVEGPLSNDPVHKTLRQLLDEAGTPEGIADFLRKDEEHISLMVNTVAAVAYAIIISAINCATEDPGDGVGDRKVGQIAGWQKFVELLARIATTHPDMSDMLGVAILVCAPYIGLADIVPEHVLNEIAMSAALQIHDVADDIELKA